MKLKLIFVLIVIAVSATVIYPQCTPIDTARLNKAYRELKKTPDSLDSQKNFFHAFPSTWMEFMLTYNNPCNARIYHFYMSKQIDLHLYAFQKMIPLIPDTIYCNKLINLGIGGKWDSGVSAALQRITSEVMNQKPRVMFICLSKQTRGFQLRFWQFYWSSSQKLDTNVAQFRYLKNMFRASMPEQVEIMETGFEFASEEFKMYTKYIPFVDFPYLYFGGRPHPLYYF